MNADGGATTARWGWKRVVVGVLAIACAIVMVAGYGAWAVFSPRFRLPGALPATENPEGMLTRLKSQIGYSPPADARVVWNHSDSGWGVQDSEDWVFFVPPGKANKDAIIAGIGHEGTLSANAVGTSEMIAGRLGIVSIGTPVWTYTTTWNPASNTTVNLSAVETDQGVCIHVKVDTAMPGR